MAKACPTPRPFSAVAGTVIFLTLLFFISFISRFIFSPLIPAIGEDIPISSGQAGTLFFMGAIGALIGSWSAGLFSARITHRGVMFIAAFGAAAGLIAAYFAGTIWYLGAVLIVLGFFAGLQTPSSVATITAMVKPDDWGKALSVQQLGPPLSLVASGLLAAALLAFFSWQTSLLWIAGLCVVVGLLFMAFRGVGYFPGDAPSPSMVGPVVRLRSFWVMIFLFALAMGAQVGVFSMLPLYLTEEQGMSTGAANTFLGLANIPPLAMVFVSGWLTDRIGAKWAIALFLFVAGVGVIFTGLLSGVGCSDQHRGGVGLRRGSVPAGLQGPLEHRATHLPKHSHGAVYAPGLHHRGWIASDRGRPDGGIVLARAGAGDSRGGDRRRVGGRFPAQVRGEAGRGMLRQINVARA